MSIPITEARLTNPTTTAPKPLSPVEPARPDTVVRPIINIPPDERTAPLHPPVRNPAPDPVRRVPFVDSNLGK